MTLLAIRGPNLRFIQLAGLYHAVTLRTMNASRPSCLIEIPAGNRTLHGTLEIPANARNIIVFAHGQASSNRSPRNRLVARSLLHRGFAILLPDLTC